MQSFCLRAAVLKTVRFTSSVLSVGLTAENRQAVRDGVHLLPIDCKSTTTIPISPAVIIFFDSQPTLDAICPG